MQLWETALTPHGQRLRHARDDDRVHQTGRLHRVEQRKALRVERDRDDAAEERARQVKQRHPERRGSRVM